MGNDLLVEVIFPIEKDIDGFPQSRDAEALLCKPLDERSISCIVMSVPFYLRNVAYGDTITTIDGPTNSLEFGRVTKRGGYSVYRVLLHEKRKGEELLRKLHKWNAITEQEDDLVAIAIPSQGPSDAVVEYILQGREKGWWGAQDGYIYEE